MIDRHPLPALRFSRTLVSIAALATMTLGAPAARAADLQMPRNMKIVVPFAPGASTDLQGRAAASAIMAKFGNTVIVALFRPDDLLIMSTTTTGSSPFLAAMATASNASRRLAADIMLFSAFNV